MNLQTKRGEISHSDKLEKAIIDARKGSQKDMTFIYNSYEAYIKTYFKKNLKNNPATDELTQDTFIKAFRSLDKYADGTSFTSWLITIARNTLIDYIRTQESERNKFDTEASDEYEDHHALAKPADYELLNKETMLLLKNTIKELPWKDKRVYSLRFIENKRYEDIASQLGVSVGTVKSHLHRVRKNIKEIILSS